MCFCAIVERAEPRRVLLDLAGRGRDVVDAADGEDLRGAVVLFAFAIEQGHREPDALLTVAELDDVTVLEGHRRVGVDRAPLAAAHERRSVRRPKVLTGPSAPR